MEKVLVTGASGFIGRQTIPFLKRQGFEVHAITSRYSTVELGQDICWHSADIFDYSKIAAICRSIGASNLLHLAWHDVPKERMTSPENLAWLGASLHLVREFTENGGKRIVLAGTCAEYDWRYGYCSEDLTQIKPDSLYGECKSSLNRIAAKFCRDNGVHYSCGRIFFVYGPHESEDRLIAYIIRSLLVNRKAELRNGELIRDYLHVTDVAEALVKLLVSDVKGSVNIGSGQPHKLREIANLVAQKLQKPGLISYQKADGTGEQAPVVFADITKLKDEVGWNPKYDLESGIESTIQWWKERNKLTLNN